VLEKQRKEKIMYIISKLCYDFLKSQYHTDYSNHSFKGKQLLDDLNTIVDRVIAELSMSEWNEDPSFVFSIVLERATRLHVITSLSDNEEIDFNELINELHEIMLFATAPYNYKQTKDWVIAYWVNCLRHLIKTFVNIVTGKETDPYVDNFKISHDIRLKKIIALCCIFLSKNPDSVPTSLRIAMGDVA